MKHQYVGDENDFRKYGLLRVLTGGSSGLTLGVNWMLTSEDGSTDGQFTSYVRQPHRWRHYDPELFDALRDVLAGGARDVSQVERSGILGPARFYGALLSHQREARGRHMMDALTALAGLDVLFFDPDVGIEIPSCPVGRKDSERYITWSELVEAYRRGHSVLVYQHWRREPREAFAERVSTEVGSRVGARVVHAFPTARVLFLLAAQERHEAVLAARAAAVPARWRDQIGHSAFHLDDRRPTPGGL